MFLSKRLMTIAATALVAASTQAATVVEKADLTETTEHAITAESYDTTATLALTNAETAILHSVAGVTVEKVSFQITNADWTSIATEDYVLVSVLDDDDLTAADTDRYVVTDDNDNPILGNIVGGDVLAFTSSSGNLSANGAALTTGAKLLLVKINNTGTDDTDDAAANTAVQKDLEVAAADTQAALDIDYTIDASLALNSTVTIASNEDNGSYSSAVTLAAIKNQFQIAIGAQIADNTADDTGNTFKFDGVIQADDTDLDDTGAEDATNDFAAITIADLHAADYSKSAALGNPASLKGLFHNPIAAGAHFNAANNGIDGITVTVTPSSATGLASINVTDSAGADTTSPYSIAVGVNTDIDDARTITTTVDTTTSLTARTFTVSVSVDSTANYLATPGVSSVSAGEWTLNETTANDDDTASIDYFYHSAENGWYCDLNVINTGTVAAEVIIDVDVDGTIVEDISLGSLAAGKVGYYNMGTVADAVNSAHGSTLVDKTAPVVLYQISEVKTTTANATLSTSATYYSPNTRNYVK